MAASLPVCALLHKESDGHDLIYESGCGVSLDSDEDQKVKNDIIIKMYKEKDNLKEYGWQGLEYVKKHFTKDTCIESMNKAIFSK